MKVVEVPPGPPVMSPIVAEIYGPDYAGQIAVAKQVRAAFESTADIIGVDDTVDEDAEKLVLRVSQAKAALLGVAHAARVAPPAAAAPVANVRISSCLRVLT